MILSIYTLVARVFYQNRKAAVSKLSEYGITLTFNNKDFKPETLTPVETAHCFGKSLHIFCNDKTDMQRDKFTDSELNELRRRSVYIEELKQMSTTGGCGGVKLRQHVINEVSSMLNDTRGVSPSQLARWFNTSLKHPDGLAATLPKYKYQRP